MIKNVSTLFYDQPELLHGTDGLEFFVPKKLRPPQNRPYGSSGRRGAHARYGRVSFRVAVRMLLLCEKRSRSQPPDLTRRKVRCLGDSDDGSSSEYSSSESESEYEDENGNMVKKEKEPGTVDEDKMPPIWDQVTERVLGEFEKMTLKIEPMTDDQCWEDATAQKEENERVADALRAGETRQAGPDGVAAGVAAAAGRRAAAIEEVEADHRESQPRGADAVVQAPEQREASVHGDEGGARGEEREEGPREEEV